MKKGKFSLRGRFSSIKFALNGLKVFFWNEHNARIHLFASIMVICVGFILKLNQTEWLFILSALTLVFISEAFNTAIEKLTDIVSPEWNKKAGIIKDISAGAVLLASVLSIIIGCLIFIPKLLWT